MSSEPYILAGTNPPRDWETGPTDVFEKWLASKWDDTFLGMPITDIQWAQPYSGDRDIAIHFERINSFPSDDSLGDIYENEDIYIQIHIFARSIYQKYYNATTGKKSSEFYLDLFEKWIRKSIKINKFELADEGFLHFQIIDTRDIPINSNYNAELPRDEFDYHEDEVKRRVMLLEVRVQHIHVDLA